MKNLYLGAALLALAACGGEGEPATSAGPETAPAETAEAPGADASPSAMLDAVLAAQDEDVKARYQYRHPKETLTFFGIEPGMTVVDTLPGAVWYSGILAAYLGPEGRVIGADYSMDMWRLFGGFADEEWLARREDWPTNFPAQVEELGIEDGAPVETFVYGSLPAPMNGQADAVLMIRAIHHFNRFEDDGGHFTTALADTYDVLKPGGVLGIVQHRAPETASDEWANGDNGYLKQSHVIEFVEAAGFELVEASEINANPKDQPTEDDVVWRLPPTLAMSAENPELRAEMEEIGESDRMTLKFRKPQ